MWIIFQENRYSCWTKPNNCMICDRIRICDRWMQKGTMDRRGRSHPLQLTTSGEDRQIVRMAMMDHSITSRIVAQHIESVMHHLVSARTIRRRLQHSGRSANVHCLVYPCR
ncbi:transposable element Tcb1 transposase [Trichonephila clavipes]|nr:transposable element Tcb1 transposase [Trichonephila clavipes]